VLPGDASNGNASRDRHSRPDSHRQPDGKSALDTFALSDADAKLVAEPSADNNALTFTAGRAGYAVAGLHRGLDPAS
jgi:hypothetical protein